MHRHLGEQNATSMLHDSRSSQVEPSNLSIGWAMPKDDLWGTAGKSHAGWVDDHDGLDS